MSATISKKLTCKLISKGDENNMFQTKIFKKYFPLDNDKIYDLNELDRKKIMQIFNKASSEIRGEAYIASCKTVEVFPLRAMLFSDTRYIEILQGYEKNIALEDLDIMNMLLYRYQYVFPFSFWFKPLLPKKYWQSNKSTN